MEGGYGSFHHSLLFVSSPFTSCKFGASPALEQEEEEEEGVQGHGQSYWTDAAVIWGC